MADLEVEKFADEHYLVLRLNRPQALNALTSTMQRDLNDAMSDFAEDPQMRVAILTGTGRAFCAGADLVSMAERNARADDIETRYRAGQLSAGERQAHLQEANADRSFAGKELPRFPFGACHKPVIAAINGLCVGGGLELVVDCDIRIASDDAYFGAFEVKRGVMARNAAQHLARVLPVGEAMYLLLTAGRLSAQRAHQLGFLQELTPTEQLMECAVEIAKTIASNAPLSVQGSKSIVQFWRHYALAEAGRFEEYVWEKVYGSKDAKEGVQAFVDRRPPQWTGS